jgi:hypothetical protein
MENKIYNIVATLDRNGFKINLYEVNQFNVRFEMFPSLTVKVTSTNKDNISMEANCSCMSKDRGNAISVIEDKFKEKMRDMSKCLQVMRIQKKSVSYKKKVNNASYNRKFIKC